MKKYLIAILFGLFTVTQASAELGVNVGLSGSAGLFAASGKEEAGKTHKGNEHGAAGWYSVFIEKTIGDRVAIGVDYVPDALESETTESVRHDKTSSATASAVENKIQIDFQDLTTVYLSVNLTDSMYAKVGYMKVDVITNESLGTGSTYGDTDLDGQSIGFGTNMTMDNGVFIRAEANYMTFDSSEGLTSGDNTVTLTNLDGVSASLKIGKSF
tara:strand:- start:72 stop:713 length:642 start_codon:yes stop_codon:yes gene_type:complete